MKIDLHIHSKTCSDGKMSLPDVFAEAHRRGISFISITDHDSIECQESADALAGQFSMDYLYGVELNIAFSHPNYKGGKPISLDVLGYQYDVCDEALVQKVKRLKEYRRQRAELILERINQEFRKEDLPLFTSHDLEAIEETVDGAFGRPHIADYMVRKGLVSDRQAAFDRYLVRCDVPKMPVSLEEASALVRGAGGKLVLAHPNNMRGTSLISLTQTIAEQHRIIKETMLPYLDGLECWHPGHTRESMKAYVALAKELGLMMTGGSDCHQQPTIMGTVDVPDWVAEQFSIGPGYRERRA